MADTALKGEPLKPSGASSSDDAKIELLGDYLDAWLASIASTVRPTTFAGYSGLVRDHLAPELGRIALNDLTPLRVSRFMTELLESGNRRGKTRGGLSPRTVRACHQLLRRAVADALSWGLVERNVVALIRPPRNCVTAPKTWSADELRRFLEHVRLERLYGAWLLCATTGMRRGEVLGLRWSDVDLEGSRVAVRQALVCVGYRILVSDPKTARGARSIALDKATVAQMEKHREVMAAEGHDLSGLVFCDPDGSPVHPIEFARSFGRRARRAGLPPIRFHDLRHTYASLSLAAGIHPKVVSERLGHANITITLDIYSHVLPSLQEEAANKVASIILG